MRVLITGGAGYVGSHTCVSLAELGAEVVVLDNFSTGVPAAIARIGTLVGKIPYVEADVRDHDRLVAVLKDYRIDAVVHCAALKAVGDSCARPIEYFDNNISGTITLLRAMQDVGVRVLVFSSSATVYGAPDSCPIREEAPLRVTNPYGRTKLVMEDLIRDACRARPALRAGILRYFNPVGAHPSGLIGDAPRGVPDNLMPYICQVAVGRRPALRVFGADYPTPDGTGRRDYIHVVDLAHAHARTIKYLCAADQTLTVNLGTGRSTSVLELVRAMESASGRRIPYEVVERRPGDVAEVYADPSLANRVLCWQAELGLEAMCEDAWRWQTQNPDGYQTT